MADFAQTSYARNGTVPIAYPVMAFSRASTDRLVQRCGRAIVDAVRSLHLEIRAGVQTGECEVMGDKLGGIAVHVGARVLAQAAPGEVLVSATVKDLV
ncbi:MAG: hypothetical protein WAO08_31180, partial [Hyphomicrobiaceae bacterium]